MADYKQVIGELSQAGINENHYQWYGFILGLLCRKYDPSSRMFLAFCAKVMNDDEPLPGVLVAYLTNYALDCERNLKNKADAKTLFALPDNTCKKEERLNVLSDLAYGLSLGLVADSEGTLTHKITDQDLLDDLHTLSAIAQVDPNEDLAEEDLDEVLNFMRDATFKAYKKSHS